MAYDEFDLWRVQIILELWQCPQSNEVYSLVVWILPQRHLNACMYTVSCISYSLSIRVSNCADLNYCAGDPACLEIVRATLIYQPLETYKGWETGPKAQIEVSLLGTCFISYVPTCVRLQFSTSTRLPWKNPCLSHDVSALSYRSRRRRSWSMPIIPRSLV